MSASSESQISPKIACDECKIELKTSDLLKSHVENTHVLNSRRGRSFNYVLNENRAKAKILKGAKRAKNLDVEVKSGCVNLRFNDGSYFNVVLPVLRDWHKQLKKTFKLDDLELKVEESDAGIEDSEKHTDTKLVIIANNDRLVLHAYNGTQNLMGQGRNYENFAIKYLEPFFTKRINSSLDEIEKFNDNVMDKLGKRKRA